MKRSFLSPQLVVLSLVVLPVGYRAVTWLARSEGPGHFKTELIPPGRDLFSHEWTAGDPLAGKGDGLGPVFNATSCVACHRQGGAGGGGPLENNVTTFTVRADKPSQPTRQGVVHAFAVDDKFQETLSNVTLFLPSVRQPVVTDLIPQINQGCNSRPNIDPPSGIDISQRNTPALFGARLIDSIPDRAIIANERKQMLKWGLATAESEELPVGRALRLADGRVGKFGWKAQTATLSDFVRAACANELGLGNPDHSQPSPLSSAEYRPPALDLTDMQCNEITAFVTSLSRPEERVPQDPQKNNQAQAGKALFRSIGCADCHAPELGNVNGIYSDLLLHRMGQTLVGGGSYGDPPPRLPELVAGDAPHASEWRTPPLWGVADSAPYLHDGRAATLADAILAHGGQADRSKQLYVNLPQSDRDCILAFLATLHAPGDAKPVLFAANNSNP